MSPADETGWPTLEGLADDDARAVLRDGDVEVLGRMPWSSNATFLVCLTRGSDQLLAIYDRALDSAASNAVSSKVSG